MNRKLGDQMSFTGGAEHTPKVTVARWPVTGMHYGDRTFLIEQEGHIIFLSPETMKAILQWYEDKL